MRFDKSWLEKKWVAYTIATCSAVLLFVMLMNLPIFINSVKVMLGYLRPVIAGVVIAYMMNPMLNFFERTVFSKIKARSLRRSLGVLLTALVVIAVVTLLLVAILPQIIGNIALFVNNFDSYATSLLKIINSFRQQAARFNVDISEFTNVSDSIIKYLTKNIPNNVGSIINTSMNIGKGVFNAILAFIFAVYFLSDKERMVKGAKHLLKLIMPERRYVESALFWKKCNKILLSYMGGELLDALIVGAANFIFMTVTGMNYKILVSVVVGVTNLAPTFGPIIGCVIGTFILLFASPWDALLFLIFTVIIQTVDGYVLKPKLFGSSLGVSSLWILIAIMLFGKLFGIIGILLAIPLAAICDFIYEDWILKKLEKRKAARKAAAAVSKNDGNN
ncbi:MAG: AI-2E family transporter [Lachnospiraceae bacterium]|nr:AI-2E family transporter [Lachnospiraceae bacterium]